MTPEINRHPGSGIRNVHIKSEFEIQKHINFEIEIKKQMTLYRTTLYVLILQTVWQ